MDGREVSTDAGALGNSNGAKVRAAGTLVSIWADVSSLEGKEAWYDGSPTRSAAEYAARNGSLFAMNLLLAAWSHGVGTRPMIGYEPDLLREVLDVPADWHPVLFAAMGYADGPPEHPRDRLDVDEVLTLR